MVESSKVEYGPVLTCSQGEYGPVLTCSRGEYEKILQAHGVNTRKYWLVEVIENGCIVTRVRVYDEILPEPSGNPSGSVLGISFGLRQYFIVYPSSRHNTVTVYSLEVVHCLHSPGENKNQFTNFGLYLSVHVFSLSCLL